MEANFAGILVLLMIQTGALLFWGGRTYQMLQELQKNVRDHEERIRDLEGVKP